MNRNKVLRLVENPKMTLFASSSSGPQASQYFIAAELANVQPEGVTAVGRACNSYKELEMIAEEIRQDLESILAEARVKLGYGPGGQS
jgi:hypothetical protein